MEEEEEEEKGNVAETRNTSAAGKQISILEPVKGRLEDMANGKHDVKAAEPQDQPPSE
jgi:hypothetical protein